MDLFVPEESAHAKWLVKGLRVDPVTQSPSHGILQIRLDVDPFFSKFLPSFRHGVGIYMASLVPPAVHDLQKGG